jgi:hypothetical protein
VSYQRVHALPRKQRSSTAHSLRAAGSWVVLARQSSQAGAPKRIRAIKIRRRIILLVAVNVPAFEISPRSAQWTWITPASGCSVECFAGILNDCVRQLQDSQIAGLSGTPSQKPVFVFLAEDNPADAGLVRRALEEHGVEGELVVFALQSGRTVY